MATLTCSSSYFCFISCLVVLSLFPLPCLSADPDPLQDVCIADLNASISINGFPCKPASQVTSDDFFYDGLIKPANTTVDTNVRISIADVFAFPGLNTAGLTLIRLDLGPGGLVPPHTHPRGSESGIVISGKILVGIVTTENVYYSKIISAGEAFIIPRGLLHFQINVGKRDALFFTSLNSQAPGFAVVAFNLFATEPSIPDEVLTKAFRVDQRVVDTIKSNFGA